MVVWRNLGMMRFHGCAIVTDMLLPWLLLRPGIESGTFNSIIMPLKYIFIITTIKIDRCETSIVISYQGKILNFQYYLKILISTTCTRGTSLVYQI